MLDQKKWYDKTICLWNDQLHFSNQLDFDSTQNVRFNFLWTQIDHAGLL